MLLKAPPGRGSFWVRWPTPLLYCSTALSTSLTTSLAACTPITHDIHTMASMSSQARTHPRAHPPCHGKALLPSSSLSANTCSSDRLEITSWCRYRVLWRQH